MKAKNNRRKKGFAQTDYVVAIGIFILVFALVIQYVSNYFSTVGDTTNIRVMNSQATSLLDIAERGYEPGHWPNTPANDSLVVTLLHLDNSTLDSSQYGNNGTMSGSVNCSAVITGRLDKGCSLNGTNGYIEINRQVHDNFTLTLWFKTNDAGGENHWLTKPLMHSETAFVANDFGFGISANGTLAFGNGDGTSDYTVHGTTVVNDGTWHHGAVTREKSGTIRIFVDGILDKTGTGSITSLTSDSKIQIGYGDDGGGYLNGTIDEVAIWNRSLNESEIYSLWAYENLLDRIGLSTRAYRFVVVVNNSASYWKNQSQAVETIGNELVKVNFTELGYGASVPSVAVYEANGSRVGYEINGNVVTFRTAVGANSAKNFTVYFDDDSTFVEQTQSITGVDNLSEVMEPVQAVQIIQNRKMSALENANYTRVKNSTGLPRDFGIRMNDVDASSSVLSFGPPVPPSGNIVSFRRFTLYQNATGAIRKARMTIQVW